MRKVSLVGPCNARNFHFTCKFTRSNLAHYDYRISANSFRGNYSFLEAEVRQLFKGGNYSREKTIDFFNFNSNQLISVVYDYCN